MQIMMYFQSTGRNQRPRGFNVKPAFQFTLTLAVCIWLLYQIKHSNNRKDVESLQAKFGQRNSVMILGRKGDVELSDKGMYMSDSNDVILDVVGEQKDRGGGDHEFGNVDEKGGNETLYKLIERIHGDVKTNAEEEGKKMKPAIPYNLSSNSEKIEIEMRDTDYEVSEDNFQGVETSKRIVSNLEGGGDEDWQKQINSDEREHESGTNLVEQGDEKDLERHTKELQEDEISIDAVKRGKEGETGSSKENGEDKDLRSKEITKLVNGTENATILGQSEVANQLHGFHDENGVPQGGNDLVEFTLASQDMIKQTIFYTKKSSQNRTIQVRTLEAPKLKKFHLNQKEILPILKQKLRAQRKAQKVMLIGMGTNSEANFRSQK